MRSLRPPKLDALEALMWVGLLGAPAAWTVQHVTGYGLTEAACGVAGSRWSTPVDAWTIVVTAIAASLALLAGVAAVLAFMRTRKVEGSGGSEEPPPKGRIHFLAVIGMTISPLFLAIILMSGLGSIFLANCVQS
jgi:hypothetical protein